MGHFQAWQEQGENSKVPEETQTGGAGRVVIPIEEGGWYNVPLSGLSFYIWGEFFSFMLSFKGANTLETHAAWS